MKQLFDTFEKYIELQEEEKNFLRENIPVHMFQRNQYLLKEGEVSNAFFFILEGGARLFYNNNAEEKTAFFYFENSFASSYASFTKELPATHNLQCIEDSKVALISKEVAYGLIEKFPKFEFLARVIMEEELIMCQDVIASFVTMSAEERYLNTIQNNKQLLQRIPLNQLATYLGVTAETLSRIRKRIATPKSS